MYRRSNDFHNYLLVFIVFLLYYYWIIIVLLLYESELLSWREIKTLFVKINPICTKNHFTLSFENNFNETVWLKFFTSPLEPPQLTCFQKTILDVSDNYNWLR